MRSLARLQGNWRALIAMGAALGALALVWVVRPGPFQPAALVRVDALSAFFGFALLGSAALSALARPSSRPVGWRGLVAGALLLAAWSTTLTPAIVGAYIGLAVVVGFDRRRTADRSLEPVASRGSYQEIARWVWRTIRRWLRAAPYLTAAGALLVGYGALAVRGALRYDTRTAGAGMDGFVFWFVLLAAVIPVSVLAEPLQTQNRQGDKEITSHGWRAMDDTRNMTRDTAHPFTHSPIHSLADVCRFAWLYPLARLYSLGPWNTGWAFAALLLGGGAALWAALAALTQPVHRRDLMSRSLLGLALAGIGLGTGAGIAAGCYGVLAYLVIAIGGRDKQTSRQADEHSSPDHSASSPSLLVFLSPWLLSGAIPLTAPFVAAWMLVGASVAGGVTLLAGVAWLVVLLSGLTVALGGPPAVDRRALLVAAGASVALGAGAPLVMLALIQPVIEQLQGGLAPFGDVNIWPWVGLATIDAAHTPVTTLPSIAVAAFMLVLSALVYLIVRLRGAWAPETPPAARASGQRALLAILRDEVPWLGALAPPVDEGRHVDGE
jgi:hypothetical protein